MSARNHLIQLNYRSNCSGQFERDSLQALIFVFGDAFIEEKNVFFSSEGDKVDGDDEEGSGGV